MASVRDNTSLWLHNKLGTSNDSWISGSICSQLNKEVLRNIKECFPDLQTQVKLKLLLSFFHIPRRLVEEVTQNFFFAGEILKKSSFVKSYNQHTQTHQHTHTRAANQQRTKNNNKKTNDVLVNIKHCDDDGKMKRKLPRKARKCDVKRSENICKGLKQ